MITEELIPGIDPKTGEPDSRYDGRITDAVGITRTDAVHPAPNPRQPGLLLRSSDLVIANDLGVGLADLAEDQRLRSQADEIRRGLEERYRR